MSLVEVQAVLQTNSVEKSPSGEGNCSSPSQEFFSHFMGLESSLPCSQEPAICPFTPSSTLLRAALSLKYEGRLVDTYRWRIISYLKTYTHCDCDGNSSPSYYHVSNAEAKCWQPQI